MRLANPVSHNGPDAIRHSLLQRLQYATHSSLSSVNLISVVDAAEDTLESLPLATGAYCVARNRLQNARRYLRSDERGARGVRATAPHR